MNTKNIKCTNVGTWCDSIEFDFGKTLDQFKITKNNIIGFTNDIYKIIISEQKSIIKKLWDSNSPVIVDLIKYYYFTDNLENTKNAQNILNKIIKQNNCTTSDGALDYITIDNMKLIITLDELINNYIYSDGRDNLSDDFISFDSLLIK